MQLETQWKHISPCLGSHGVMTCVGIGAYSAIGQLTKRLDRYEKEFDSVQDVFELQVNRKPGLWLSHSADTHHSGI